MKYHPNLHYGNYNYNANSAKECTKCHAAAVLRLHSENVGAGNVAPQAKMPSLRIFAC
jgi:hypothetical protein